MHGFRYATIRGLTRPPFIATLATANIESEEGHDQDVELPDPKGQRPGRKRSRVADDLRAIASTVLDQAATAGKVRK